MILYKALLILVFFASTTKGQELINITNFSERPIGYDLLQEWHQFDFKNIPHTEYNIVDNENRRVVKAVSNSSASGLIKEIDIDPNEYPIIEWSWKITDLVDKGNVTKRSGDDYAARIYITFDLPIDSLPAGKKLIYFTASRFYPEGTIPIRALNYIWANKAEVNSIHSNPWTSLSQMIVVQSGSENMGKWVTQRMNIKEDYFRIFKADPPKIKTIAIMTDSDNTKGNSSAFYGDILFKKAEQ